MKTYRKYTEKQYSDIKIKWDKYVNCLCLRKNGDVYGMRDWKVKQLTVPVKTWYGRKTKENKIVYIFEEFHMKTNRFAKDEIGVIYGKNIQYIPHFIERIIEDRKRFLKLKEQLDYFNLEITKISNQK